MELALGRKNKTILGSCFLPPKVKALSKLFFWQGVCGKGGAGREQVRVCKQVACRRGFGRQGQCWRCNGLFQAREWGRPFWAPAPARRHQLRRHSPESGRLWLDGGEVVSMAFPGRAAFSLRRRHPGREPGPKQTGAFLFPTSALDLA